MNLLCLDTATDALTCAVRTAAGEVLEHHEVAPRQHAERVLEVLDELLARAGLSRARVDAIGFGRGPGSFTGLRIGAGVSQGLAFALEVPVVPVSTLAAIAEGARRERGARAALVTLDARMGEVYAAAMRAVDGNGDGAGEIMQLMGEERLCRVDALEEEFADMLAGPPEGGWFGCGPGWEACADALAGGLRARLSELEPERLPRGSDVATLARAAWEEGGAVAAEEALPVYMRRPVVTSPRNVEGGERTA